MIQPDPFSQIKGGRYLLQEKAFDSNRESGFSSVFTPENEQSVCITFPDLA